MPTLRSTRRRRVVLAIAATVILTSVGAIPAAAAEIVTPYVIATTPAEGEIDVAVGATLSVTFSEPVTVTGDWFSIDCNLSANHPAAASGGPLTWSIDPVNDFVAGESCALTITAADITDQDNLHPMSNGFVGFTIAGVPAGGPTTTFSGFKWPIKALPAVNRARAGWSIPIRFSLGGDPGPHTFSAASERYTCGTTPPSTATVKAATRGHKTVRYNGHRDTYTFVWKTSRSWKHSCRVFVLSVDDGPAQVVAFRFK